MAKIGLNLKIDVTKIDKNKLFKGEKGTYLDATIFVDLDEQDQYGNNGMIVQAQTKEERDAGTQSAILGNGRIFWQGEGQSQSPQQQQPQQQGGPAPQEPKVDFDDDIPF